MQIWICVEMMDLFKTCFHFRNGLIFGHDPCLSDIFIVYLSMFFMMKWFNFIAFYQWEMVSVLWISNRTFLYLIDRLREYTYPLKHPSYCGTSSWKTLERQFLKFIHQILFKLSVLLCIISNLNFSSKTQVKSISFRLRFYPEFKSV